jgi:hypothetical protein
MKSLKHFSLPLTGLTLVSKGDFSQDVRVITSRVNFIHSGRKTLRNPKGVWAHIIGKD